MINFQIGTTFRTYFILGILLGTASFKKRQVVLAMKDSLSEFDNLIIDNDLILQINARISSLYLIGDELIGGIEVYDNYVY